MSARSPAILCALALTAFCVSPSQAMAPLPRPEVDPTIPPGQSDPFAGSWSVTVPTRDPASPDNRLAICTLPVRIEAADATRIRYLAPGEVASDTVMALAQASDGTSWMPEDAGPAFFALWTSADQFYLYQAPPKGEPDWAAPYLYDRCP